MNCYIWGNKWELQLEVWKGLMGILPFRIAEYNSKAEKDFRTLPFRIKSDILISMFFLFTLKYYLRLICDACWNSRTKAMNEIWGLDFLRRRQRERDRLQYIAHNRARLRGIRDSSDPFAVDDFIFKGLYRLPKQMVRGLVEELRPHMAVARRSTAIPIELKVS